MRLRRYPNFTQIERISPLDMQLATLCALAPRSVRELQRLFAQGEQEVLRFVVLSVLSGLAVLAPAAPLALAPVGVSDGRARAEVRSTSEASLAKRSFFKALLGKLF